MEIERTDAYILVRGEFTVLSSAVFNGGLKEHVRAIVNAKVGDDFNEDLSLIHISEPTRPY